MTTKRFPISVVLSATTGQLLCDMDGVYEILNHVTGDNLFTHQLPRAFEYGKPLLVAMDARLGERVVLPSDLANGTREDAFRRVAACVEVHVASLGLPAEMDVPSFADGWSRMDPVAELAAMMSKDVA